MRYVPGLKSKRSSNAKELVRHPCSGKERNENPEFLSASVRWPSKERLFPFVTATKKITTEIIRRHSAIGVRRRSVCHYALQKMIGSPLVKVVFEMLTNSLTPRELFALFVVVTVVWCPTATVANDNNRQKTSSSGFIGYVLNSSRATGPGIGMKTRGVVKLWESPWPKAGGFPNY